MKLSALFLGLSLGVSAALADEWSYGSPFYTADLGACLPEQVDPHFFAVYGAVYEGGPAKTFLNINADTQRDFASLNKMMTAILAYDRIYGGKAALTDQVVISKHAARLRRDKDLPGASVPLSQALSEMGKRSSNLMSVAIAETLAGDEIRFVNWMNIRAKAIGMKNTAFQSASGATGFWNLSTPRDLHMLAVHLDVLYPQYRVLMNQFPVAARQDWTSLQGKGGFNGQYYSLSVTFSKNVMLANITMTGGVSHTQMQACMDATAQQFLP